MKPATAFGVGASALGIGFGIAQKIQARSLEKKNVMPAYNVSNLIAQNAAQAQNMAKLGMAQQQYNNTINQQDQNLANVLSTASRSGRNIPTAGLLRQANIATQNLNAQDAQLRQQNQRFAMQQNSVLAQEQRAAWNWNQAQPYLRTAQQVAQMRDAGNQNIFGGIGAVSSMGMSGAFGGTGGGQAQAPTGTLTGQPITSTIGSMGGGYRGFNYNGFQPQF